MKCVNKNLICLCEDKIRERLFKMAFTIIGSMVGLAIFLGEENVLGMDS